eukprot:1470533-Lingulodinium_polyedra.AAC.1
MSMRMSILMHFEHLWPKRVVNRVVGFPPNCSPPTMWYVALPSIDLPAIDGHGHIVAMGVGLPKLCEPR